MEQYKAMIVPILVAIISSVSTYFFTRRKTLAEIGKLEISTHLESVTAAQKLVEFYDTEVKKLILHVAELNSKLDFMQSRISELEKGLCEQNECPARIKFTKEKTK